MRETYLTFLLWLCCTLRQVLLESCQATNGETGQCVSIFSCPSLIRSFENPRKGYEEYLRKFECASNSTNGLSVCCRTGRGPLVFENSNDNVAIDKVAPINNLDICGLRNSSDSLTLQGNISVYEFPWLVAIATNNYSGYDDPTVVSTGSLINARYVLTDAASIVNITQANNYYYVRVGEYDVSKQSCPEKTPLYVVQACAQYTDYNIKERIIHPFYKSNANWNNIALLRLATVVSFKYYNRPICLPTPISKELKQEKVFYLASWNKTEISTSVNKWSIQKKVLITHVAADNCERIFNKTIFNDENGICASKLEPATNISCNDIINSHIMSFDGVRWHLEGISKMCANDGNAIVYTKVNNYMSWIRQYTENEECLTPNGDKGECMYITECPKLMKAFANAREDDVEYLRDFICGHKNVDWMKFRRWRFPPVVCCNFSPDFKVFNDNRQLEEVTEDLDKRQASPLADYCGLQNRDGYYLARDNITTDEFPWVAAIYRVNPYNNNTIERQSRYSGAIITSRYVITAAHSLRGFIWAGDSYIVRLGEYQTDNNNDCLYFQEFESEDCSNVIDYGVERQIAHPFFNIFNNLNDIALLRVNKTIEFSDYIRPICLPTPDLQLAEGNILYATGWGFTTSGERGQAVVKKKIASVQISQEQCREKYLVADRKFISTPHLCSSYVNNDTFTCISDNGGPLMVSFKRKWYLVGILTEFTCEYTQPQIHTRVTEYLQWIYDTMLMMTKESNLARANFSTIN